VSSTDYFDLQHIESVKTLDGYQLEKYQDKKTGDFTVLFRDQRFGPVYREEKGLQEQDADQLLVAGENDGIEYMLEER
jgi:hypothetical protein